MVEDSGSATDWLIGCVSPLDVLFLHPARVGSCPFTFPPPRLLACRPSAGLLDLTGDRPIVRMCPIHACAAMRREAYPRQGIHRVTGLRSLNSPRLCLASSELGMDISSMISTLLLAPSRQEGCGALRTAPCSTLRRVCPRFLA